MAVRRFGRVLKQHYIFLMDLIKEFLAEVLNERICLASNFSSVNEKKNLTTTTNYFLYQQQINNKNQQLLKQINIWRI